MVMDEWIWTFIGTRRSGLITTYLARESSTRYISERLVSRIVGCL